MRALNLIVVSSFLALAACASIKEAAVGPTMSPMSAPALQASMGAPAAIMASPSQIPPSAAYAANGASANSLWRPGARAFFIDQRANRVGDILTINITIDDSAQLSNSTDASRKNGTQGGVPHFFGLEQALGGLFPAGYDPAKMIEQSGSTMSSGAGSVKRQEKIQLTIAAIVTGVLPNGNLVIQGTQEVRTNTELRQLTIAGIVRPEDISSANTVRHTQIAEARISYGGRGDISRVQKTPAGQSLVERFSPF